jgi:hypothetical protein
MKTSSQTKSGGVAREFIPPIVDACKLPLAKVGMHDAPPLGCGVYGCVYPTTNAARVVKVVDKDSENEVSGALWLLTIGARRPAELPLVYGVYRLAKCTEGKLAYVIEREDVGNTGIKTTKALDNALFTIERAGDSNDCAWADAMGKSFYTQLASDFDSPDVKDLLRAAWRLQVWSCRNEVTITDTHPVNWGRRTNGEFVLRDFGNLYARIDGYGPAGASFNPTRLPAFGGLKGW